MLFKSGLIVAFFTLMSRFFGIARELFIAALFGTSAIADCVNVAMRLPNLFRRIFGEGALASVFIPMFSEKLATSNEDAKIFSGEVFSLLTVTLIILTILLQIFMPSLIFFIAPGFAYSNTKYHLAIVLCRLTIPYIIFVSAVALFGGMLNSVRKFAAFAFVPIIMNICIITIPYLSLNYIKPYYSISFALLIAGVIQVGFMYYCIVKAGLKIPVCFRPQDTEVKKLLKKMGPAALGSGAQQLNLFISQSIASFLPGAISLLAYADRLYQLPLSLIGVTFSTILLPELTQVYKKQEYNKANLLQNKAITIACMISIPATMGLFIMSPQIIHVIYERGKFTANDTLLTAQALSTFALGLPAFVIAKIITPIFYANFDTQTPLRITIYSLITNTILNIILMLPLGHNGIALGSSIAAWVNIILLNKYAARYGNFSITDSTKQYIYKTIICGIIMSGYLLIVVHYFNNLLLDDTLYTNIIALFGIIGGAVVIFTISAYCLKVHYALFTKTSID